MEWVNQPLQHFQSTNAWEVCFQDIDIFKVMETLWSQAAQIREVLL